MGTLTAPPTRGQLWMQAHAETCRLPSWARGNACRDRFEALLRQHGHIDTRIAR